MNRNDFSTAVSSAAGDIAARTEYPAAPALDPSFTDRVIDYWAQRADAFSALRVREFESQKHALWMAEFEKYIPLDRPLRILDVGTGTGFFAFLLAAAGHQTVGIDLVPEMIDEARKTSARLAINAEFFVMDASAPAFPVHSFDVIVSRNLTWTLPDVAQAYRNWHQLLKPGGILVNFDADYCHEKPVTVLPENHAHKYISQDMKDEYERFKDALRQTQGLRPQWDVQLLQHSGFTDIRVDAEVWARIYADFDEFYNPTPIFTIAARA